MAFPALVFGVVLFVGLLLLAKWWSQAQPGQILRLIRWVAIVSAAVLALYLVLASRWSWLPWLLLAGLPWLRRQRARSQHARNAAGPVPGRSSGVDTPFLRMTLDHDSGEMEGEVLAGVFAGRRLSQLKLGELLDLRRECLGDQASLQVLESYLDRIHGAPWRDLAGDDGADTRTAAGNAGSMSVEEACEILGVNNGTSAAEIEKSYRRMMKQAHPDQGGSDWMAAKINQAKDLLLAR